MLAQGAKVKKDTPRLPEPSGDRKGVVGSGPALNLILIGDSGAAGVGADSMEESLLGQIKSNLSTRYELSYELLARTGATTRSTLNRLNKVADRNVDVVVSSLGVNDVTKGRSLSTFLDEQTSLVHLLRSKFSAKQIIISGYPPVGKFPALPHPLRWYLGRQSRHFDRKLEGLAKSLGCDFLDLDLNDGDLSYMASDGFHPSSKVYAIWGRMVAEKVEVRGER